MSSSRFITEQGNFSWTEIFHHFKRKKFWIIAGSLIGLGLGVGFVLTMPPRYEAEAVIQVSSLRDSLTEGVNTYQNIMMMQYENVLEKERDVLNSRDFRVHVAKNLMKHAEFNYLNFLNPFSKKGALMAFLGFENKPEQTMDFVSEAIAYLVNWELDHELRSIRFKSVSLDPKTSFVLAGVCAETLVDLRHSQMIRSLKGKRDVIEKNIEELSVNLEKSEVKLAQVKTQLGSGEGSMPLIRRFENSISQERELASELSANESALISLKKELDALNQYLSSGQEESFTRMRDNFATWNYNLMILAQREDPESKKQYNDLKKKIEKIKFWISKVGEKGLDNPIERRRFLVSQIPQFESKKKILNSRLIDATNLKTSIKKSIETAPYQEAQLFRLKRNIQLNSELYSSLMVKLQDLDIKLRGMKESLKVVSDPTIPYSPIKISIFTSLLFFTFAGAFLTSITLLALAWFDDRVGSESELKSIGIDPFGSG